MAIPMNYAKLKERHDFARSLGNSVTTGNRCALVMGVALKIKPKSGQTTFKEMDDVKPGLKGQAFMQKFFVKASDAAAGISEAYGAPSVTGAGPDVYANLIGRKGVIYLEDCWRTKKEKIGKMLGIATSKTGDHIDLWDGSDLEIYRDETNNNMLIVASKKVMFWELA